MSRCWGCCQENCDSYEHCSCRCHRPTPKYESLETANKNAEKLVTEAHQAILHKDACPCKEHPRYAGKRRPRGTCETCWRFYIRKNP